MRDVHLYSMSTGVYESSGKYLPISYGMVETPYGSAFFAESCGRVIHLSRTESLEEELVYFQSRWHLGSPSHRPEHCQRVANRMFKADTRSNSKHEQLVRVLTMGTEFQIAVWKEICKIPEGTVASYTDIAERVGKPLAARFVAKAVSENPIAILIPCHRVVRADGTLGNYRWGAESKRDLLESEGCDLNQLGLAV